MQLLCPLRPHINLYAYMLYLYGSQSSVLDNPAPLNRESIINTLRPSFRRPSRNSVQSDGGHDPSVDHVDYNMMPKPTVYSGRVPSSPAAASVNSTSNISTRLLDSVRKMLAPRNSFQFTDYSPKRFAKIRKLSGISNEMYQQSFATTTMPDFSGGRSGAFVYFSSDYRYIVKTCTPYELETLLNLLPEYEAYLTREYRKKRNSLLTRYLGAHRIVMYDIPLYFLVMKNICFEKVDEKYDLKGSWISRHGSKKKKDPAFTWSRNHSLIHCSQGHQHVRGSCSMDKAIITRLHIL
ncbi:hypothetical protein EON65_34725, partial [archaeon]